MIQTVGGLNMNDPLYVRTLAKDADAVGHWRRLLALYGNHHPACESNIRPLWACNCGFHESVYGWPEKKESVGNNPEATKVDG